MTSRKHWLIARVGSEGYCCLNAYLRLCRARGESVKDMAINIQMSPDTIWYHYRKLAAGTGDHPKCQKILGCMDEVVSSIEADAVLKRLSEVKPVASDE